MKVRKMQLFLNGGSIEQQCDIALDLIYNFCDFDSLEFYLIKLVMYLLALNLL